MNGYPCPYRSRGGEILHFILYEDCTGINSTLLNRVTGSKLVAPLVEARRGGAGWIQSACPVRVSGGTVRTMPGGDMAVSHLESDRRGSAVLAWVGGFVDAAGFLVLLGLFTAHMSGNSTGLGVALATGHWEEAVRRGFVIPVFVLATMAGVAWIEMRTESDPSIAARNRATADVLGAEVFMLAVFFAGVTWMGSPVSLRGHPVEFVSAASAAAVAMGLQNAALRRVQSTSVHTTFVTGMLTEVAVGAVRWVMASRRADTEGAARARRATAVAGLVWTSYAVGAVMGAWLVAHQGVRMILLPAALLAIIALRLVRRVPPTSP